MIIGSRLRIEWPWATILLLCIYVTPISPQDTEIDDVTQYIEYIGNPFAERFPDGEWIYARNVWDMIVYNGKLYFGHGNSNNAGPAPNAGPVEVWFYDGQAFHANYTVDDEQIAHFEPIADALYVPGHDPAHSQSTGNMYILQDDNWRKLSTLPSVLHVYDLIQFDSQLVAAVSSKSGAENTILFSKDNGLTWTGYALDTQNDLNIEAHLGAYNVFDVSGQLFASVIPGLVTITQDDGATKVMSIGNILQYYTDERFEAYNMEEALIFGEKIRPRHEMPFRVVREQSFAGKLMFIVAQSISHQWIPISLRSLMMEGNELVSTLYPLTENQRPWDIIVSDNKLFVLASDCPNELGLLEDICTNTIYVTDDLRQWQPMLKFEATTFARSFELYGGDFYFGLGSEPEDIAPATGNIIRVPSKAFATH